MKLPGPQDKIMWITRLLQKGKSATEKKKSKEKKKRKKKQQRSNTVLKSATRQAYNRLPARVATGFVIPWLELFSQEKKEKKTNQVGKVIHLLPVVVHELNVLITAEFCYLTSQQLAPLFKATILPPGIDWATASLPGISKPIERPPMYVWWMDRCNRLVVHWVDWVSFSYPSHVWRGLVIHG